MPENYRPITDRDRRDSLWMFVACLAMSLLGMLETALLARGLYPAATPREHLPFLYFLNYGTRWETTQDELVKKKAEDMVRSREKEAYWAALNRGRPPEEAHAEAARARHQAETEAKRLVDGRAEERSRETPILRGTVLFSSWLTLFFFFLALVCLTHSQTESKFSHRTGNTLYFTEQDRTLLRPLAILLTGVTAIVFCIGGLMLVFEVVIHPLVVLPAAAVAAVPLTIAVLADRITQMASRR